MGQTLHVVPIGDLIDHDTSGEQPSCVCGPEVEHVPAENGDGWLIIHHSLDGREHDEPDSSGG